jgi:predicted transcriptional regulator
MGYSVQQIAVTFGVSRQAVESWLAAEELPQSIKKAVETGEITATAALQMAEHGHSREEQVKRFEDIKRQGKKPTVQTMRSAAAATDNKPLMKMKTRKEILKKIEEIRGNDENWARVYNAALMWVLGKDE